MIPRTFFDVDVDRMYPYTTAYLKNIKLPLFIRKYWEPRALFFAEDLGKCLNLLVGRKRRKNNRESCVIEVGETQCSRLDFIRDLSDLKYPKPIKPFYIIQTHCMHIGTEFHVDCYSYENWAEGIQRMHIYFLWPISQRLQYLYYTGCFKTQRQKFRIGLLIWREEQKFMTTWVRKCIITELSDLLVTLVQSDKMPGVVRTV
jgi:hypothetical protein